MIGSESEISINSFHYIDIINVMGNTNKKQMKVVFGGMSSSGKTSILYKLKLGQIVHVIPTIGFNVQPLQRKGTTLTIWDIGGGYALRPMMHHYLHEMCCLAYLISMDLNEKQLNETVDDLWKNFLVYIDVKIPILIYANKKDVKVMEIGRIIQKVKEVSGGRTVHFVQCCGLTGQGLEEGIEWIIERIRQQRKIKK